MSLTLLFDLDDTLLDTNLDSFIPAYFQALSNHVSAHIPPNEMIRSLVLGVNRMNENTDPTRTLQDVFDADFYPRLGVPKQNLVQALDDFYDNIFPTLGSLTRPRPDAAPLIEWALGQGFRVALATDPLFPRKATLHRIRWAGLNPDAFALISSYENFHFTKTYPTYYAEVLGQMGWCDGPALMVGNDAKRDLESARRLGLKTYFVTTEPGSGPGFEAGSGTLADLRAWLEAVKLPALEPSYQSPESVLAMMSSAPAILQSLTNELTEAQWNHEPARGVWAMNEIVCHLRDTEREIHQLQLDLMLEREDPFIPRPDTSVWANEREYLSENGFTALSEFACARLANIEKLKNLDAAVWSRRARHAIFGPTNFLEVTRFLTDHDRMHIQQAWKTLKQL